MGCCSPAAGSDTSSGVNLKSIANLSIHHHALAWAISEPVA